MNNNNEYRHINSYAERRRRDRTRRDRWRVNVRQSGKSQVNKRLYDNNNTRRHVVRLMLETSVHETNDYQRQVFDKW